jgi:hypothetical protein
VTEPEPAPGPAPAETPSKGFRFGRRNKRPKEAAPKSDTADPDGHLDWVKTLRGGETPARVGGNGPARHAKPAEEKPPAEEE